MTWVKILVLINCLSILLLFMLMKGFSLVLALMGNSPSAPPDSATVLLIQPEEPAASVLPTPEIRWASSTQSAQKKVPYEATNR